eukprot:GILK01004441.1.p1 GENE.GILK01004441.1~~GILK01004441.1.p1  ORF type:complete len:508 (+),score=120.75 GILK01004441.1:51-1526(+)
MEECTFFLTFGTYDGAFFGYEGKIGNALKTVFAFTPHGGCVRCLASQGSLLVSGSTDEIIRIFNSRRRQEAGTLMEHNGSITCLELFGAPQASHLLSGSDDGTVCIWRASDWELLHKLKGHRGGILSLSIHPSGKLALSVGKDRCLKLWNLLTGRCAYTNNLDRDLDLVMWSPKGDRYALSSASEVMIYDVESAEVVARLKHERRVSALAFLSDELLLTGGDDGSVRMWHLSVVAEKKNWLLSRVIALFQGHQARIRSIVPMRTSQTQDGVAPFFASGASDGRVRVWDLRDVDAVVKRSEENQPKSQNTSKKDAKKEVPILPGEEIADSFTESVFDLSSDVRLTCLSADIVDSHSQHKVDQHANKKKQQKRQREEASEKAVESNDEGVVSAMPKKKAKVVVEFDKSTPKKKGTKESQKAATAAVPVAGKSPSAQDTKKQRRKETKKEKKKQKQQQKAASKVEPEGKAKTNTPRTAKQPKPKADAVSKPKTK